MKCLSCSAKKSMKREYCEECDNETTHSSKGNCISCRAKSMINLRNCETHGEVTHYGSSCLSCGSQKAFFTRVEAFKANSRKNKRGMQSKPELNFLRELNLTPGYFAGFQVDGLDEDRKIAFEYDGWYWHKDTEARDLDRTMILLEAGYKVIRVRECDRGRKLFMLPINNENLHQYHHDIRTPEIELAEIIKKEVLC